MMRVLGVMILMSRNQKVWKKLMDSMQSCMEYKWCYFTVYNSKFVSRNSINRYVMAVTGSCNAD